MGRGWYCWRVSLIIKKHGNIIFKNKIIFFHLPFWGAGFTIYPELSTLWHSAWSCSASGSLWDMPDLNSGSLPPKGKLRHTVHICHMRGNADIRTIFTYLKKRFFTFSSSASFWMADSSWRDADCRTTFHNLP